MSFFDKLKQAMGFDGQCDDDDERILTESSHARRGENTVVGSSRHEAASKTAQQAPDETAQNDPAATTDLIFGSVVDLFNEQLPAFIRESVDPATQSKLIYDRLNEGVKAHLESLAVEAQRRASQHFEAEMQRLTNEINDLREAEKRAEECGQESNQQRLSAERQKRALTERVRDLEKQIATFDAEREQYELENKSLINRLRLCQVSENNDNPDEETAETLIRLTDENKTLTEQNKTLTEQNETLAEANRELATAYDELKAKSQIADAMINDLNAKASDALHRLADNDGVAEQLTEAKQRIEQLTTQCDNLQKRCQTAETEAEQGRMALQAIAEIQQELTKLETAKNKREARISELIDENADKDEQIDLLRDEIRRLNSVINSTPSQVTDDNNTYGSQSTLTQMVDQSLAETDWFLAPPKDAHTSGRRRRNESNEDDFGYQEPKRRKPMPDDPAQMSLF